MKRGNTRVRRSSRLRKRDPWEIYDRLPLAIRAALQEGPTQGSPALVDHVFRKERRIRGEADAIAETVRMLNEWHLREIAGSPHVLAGATMQTSGREIGY